MKKKLYLLTIFTAILFCRILPAQREPMPSDPKKQEQTAVIPIDKEKIVKTKQIREGTPFFTKKVYFRKTGQRTIMFTTDGKENYTVLENLVLERILTAMSEKSDRGIWLADGEFTEFQGANYVLLRRAVVAPSGEILTGK